MDVAGFQGRIIGPIEAFVVIFCLHIFNPRNVRLAFLPRFLQCIFQEVSMEQNFGRI